MHVTAVVVAHDGAAYLPRTLAAVGAQRRRPEVIVGADARSRDGSGEILREAMGDGAVVAARESFGAAVAAALAAVPRPAGSDPANEWLWLLRDDAAPEPDALAELLLAVERAPAVAVAGCKQVAWDDPRRLVDVGLYASRWAERLSLIDDDEQDQGQYDDRSDMFAVSAAGMLVRRDVWDALRGFDPALPATGDDVDFCWRARLAGHRVVVVPSARMRSAAEREDHTPSPFAQRRAEVYTRLKHTSPWALPFHFVAAILGGLWSLASGLITKEPADGAARLGGSLAALVGIGALARGRGRAARTRAVVRGTVKGVRASREDIWSYRRAHLEADYADPERIIGDGTGSDDNRSEPTGDSDHDFASLAVSAKGWAGTGAVVVTGLALAGSILALLPLLGAEAVAGGALLPVATGLGTVWQHAVSWWVALGSGQPGHADPFDLVLWLLGILGLGDANHPVAWTLILAPALAALGAWAFATALTAHRWPRIVAAFVWAAAPSLQEAVAQGRLGAVVAHVLVPWAALGMLRAVGGARIRGTSGPSHTPFPGSGGVPSWTAAAAGGLALAGATAGSPSLLPLAAVVVLGASVALRGRARSLWFALLPSVALFLPLWFSSQDNPRAWLADPGVPLASTTAAPWQLVLGQPTAFDAASGIRGFGWLPAGVPWALVLALVLGVPLVVAAAAAIVGLQGRRGASARVAGLLAVVALSLAWFLGRVPTSVSGDSLVAPFAGPAVGVGVLALLAAAVLGADAVFERRDARAHAVPARTGGRSAAAVGAVIVLALAIFIAGPAANLARWAAAGLTPAAAPAGSLGSPLSVAPSRARTLPATASDLGLGTQQTKTLVLRSTPQGGYTAALMRGSGTTLDALSAVASSRRVIGSLGAERIATDDPAEAAVRRVVAIVSSSSGVDPRADLDALGVGFVVLQQRDSGDAVTAGQMDAVPGLVAVGQTDVGWLWRVTPRSQEAAKQLEIAHRASIVDSKGAVLGYVDSGVESVDASLSAGPEGRLLVLAERSDPHWSAWVDGRRLTATTQGWSQAFTLPASGGRLEVRYEQPAALPLGILAALVIVIAVLTAVPTRVRPDAGRRPARGRGSADRRRAKARAAERRQPAAVREPREAPVPDGPRGSRNPAEPDAHEPEARAAHTNPAEPGARAGDADPSRSTDDARV
ncbi:glycosyltransferase family 2 protein [Sinomonas sp. JGH33]|uniref:Glycosyltransferase family 2 protein n=1 Tax=Sinomonas terricola TaxID=3110330 RepID=A0ABU5T920_9MICC|nr:glycosyltransferase family 2 protein [Sinomonas sp. JGH33]MEA5456199.1 glycosyltransferase family 2 protein [Sinomonas sp. JGH33]